MSDPGASHASLAAMDAACSRVGLRTAGAHLLHQRANAVFNLPEEDVIVRLRQTHGSAEWERRLATTTRVTRWLSEHGFPTVTPRFIDPVTVDDWTVTFWNYVPFRSDLRAAGMTELGNLMRQLHEMPKPQTDLIETNPLGSLLIDLKKGESGEISDESRHWLAENAEQIARTYPTAEIPLGRGLIHGDAHTGNIFATSHGYLVGDWDSVSNGPRAQDVVPVIIDVRRFSAPVSDWNDFCRAYRIDPEVVDDPGIQMLVRAREL